jgi:hypothetical protein
MHNPISNKAKSLLNLPGRLSEVVLFYLVSLMIPAPKHTLTFAAKLSNKHKSQFSRLLLSYSSLAIQCLDRLTKKISNEKSKERRPLIKQAPWTVAIIIDATLQKRSTRHTGNSQKFNHGKGFVVGHQWTNIILLINGKKIPLPPIAYYSKKERIRLNMVKETESDCIARFIKTVDLSEYINDIRDKEIIVLMDSGYDVKKIQNEIIDRDWDFISALKSSRNVISDYQSKLIRKKYQRVDNYFRNHRYSPWNTVRDSISGTKRKRRMEFRTRELRGYLKGIQSMVSLVLSEERGSRRGRKYLVCSNIGVDAGVIVRAYRKRWSIELFHKEVKSYFGFEDMSCHDFESVISHVHWVYCAYLLLPEVISGVKSLSESQELLLLRLNNQKFKKILQISGRIDGVASIKTYCLEVIKRSMAA